MFSNLLIVCLFLAGLAIQEVSLCFPTLPSADDNLNIYALPVGQGDCTVIQCPKTNKANGKGVVTIIDAGSKNNRFGKAFHNYLKGATIKYIILTHPHDDHYNLIDSILEGHAETPQVPVYHSCDWNEYKKEVAKLGSSKKIKIKRCLEGSISCNMKELKLCDSDPVTLKVIASELGDCKGNRNQDSIVSRITYKGVSTLISGDLEENSVLIKAIVNGNVHVRKNFKADIYRLAHHGAYSGTSGKYPNHPDLLKAVGASYYFSSSGLHNVYKHPRCNLFDEIKSKAKQRKLPQVDEHPYTCYKDGSSKPTSFKTKEPIYVTSTTFEENRKRKDYVIRFAIKKDGAIVPSMTLFHEDHRHQGL